jgi:hypothetical protein
VFGFLASQRIIIFANQDFSRAAAFLRSANHA